MIVKAWLPLRDSDGEERSFLFFCPGCEDSHSIRYAAHPDAPTAPVWHWNGDAEAPTFRPSLLVQYPDGRRCHSFIESGSIRFLGDCSHDLAGQTVKVAPEPQLGG